MSRTELIQYLIDKINATKYLEIGMGPGLNFNEIICDYKVCVDPYPTVSVTHEMTSDSFFEQNRENFDVIFIDGLHWAEQVYKDITNSLKILNENGYIICHDMNPHSEIIQRYPQSIPESEWTGDCWKSWVRLKKERNDLKMYVVDTDYGCGIIEIGHQDLIVTDDNLTWEYFNEKREYLLNLISVEKFLDNI